MLQVQQWIFFVVLRVELLKAVRGSLSDVQKHTLDKLTEKGYKTCVCFGAGQAIGVLDKYMSEE